MAVMRKTVLCGPERLATVSGVGLGPRDGSPGTEQLPRDQVGRHGPLTEYTPAAMATRPAPAPAPHPSRTGSAAAPAKYEPLRHPGTPGRWSDEAILRALRDWATEMGAAPRRQDWSGERPQQASRAQRKWMREHPYWPSSSCVAAHFGSWNKALHAAGLPTRGPGSEDTVAERIQAAWRLRTEGHRIRAIADQIGVSVSSNRRGGRSAPSRLPAKNCQIRASAKNTSIDPFDPRQPGSRALGVKRCPDPSRTEGDSAPTTARCERSPQLPLTHRDEAQRCQGRRH